MSANQQRKSSTENNLGVPNGATRNDERVVIVQRAVHVRKRNPALNVPPTKVRLSELNSSDWKKELSDFLHVFGRVRIKNVNQKASEATLRARSCILFSTLEDLSAVGLVRTLSQVKPKLLPVIFENWNKRGVSKRAQLNYFSTMNWFWKMCSIPTKEINTYAKYQGEFTINRASAFDKSWNGNKVDFDAIHKNIGADDEIAAAIFLTLKTFGLRPKEGICLLPHESDEITGLRIWLGTKTGKTRVILLEDFDAIECRRVIDYLKTKVKPGEYLGWPGKTLKQSIERFYTITKKYGLRKSGVHGVTAYGLRHQFAIENFQKLTGYTAPVRGGTAINYRAAAAGILKISEGLGHSRTEILGAYCGSHRSNENQQHRNFVQSWERLEPLIKNELSELLVKNNIPNLVWGGSLAMGGALKGGVYELIIPLEVDLQIAAKVGSQIEDLVMKATGMLCTVQHWCSMAQTKQSDCKVHGLPLYHCESAVEKFSTLMEAQRKTRLSGAKRPYKQNP